MERCDTDHLGVLNEKISKINLTINLRFLGMLAVLVLSLLSIDRSIWWVPLILIFGLLFWTVYSIIATLEPLQIERDELVKAGKRSEATLKLIDLGDDPEMAELKVRTVEAILL